MGGPPLIVPRLDIRPLLHEEGDEAAWMASMALVPCLTSLQMEAGELDPDEAVLPGSYLAPDQAAEQLQRLAEPGHPAGL